MLHGLQVRVGLRYQLPELVTRVALQDTGSPVPTPFNNTALLKNSPQGCFLNNPILVPQEPVLFGRRSGWHCTEPQTLNCCQQSTGLPQARRPQGWWPGSRNTTFS